MDETEDALAELASLARRLAHEQAAHATTKLELEKAWRYLAAEQAAHAASRLKLDDMEAAVVSFCEKSAAQCCWSTLS